MGREWEGVGGSGRWELWWGTHIALEIPAVDGAQQRIQVEVGCAPPLVAHCELVEPLADGVECAAVPVRGNVGSSVAQCALGVECRRRCLAFWRHCVSEAW